MQHLEGFNFHSRTKSKHSKESAKALHKQSEEPQMLVTLAAAQALCPIVHSSLWAALLSQLQDSQCYSQTAFGRYQTAGTIHCSLWK